MSTRFTPIDEKPDPGNRRASRPWLRPGVLATIALLAAIVFAPSRWPANEGSDRILLPDLGYRAAADRLAETGLLIVRDVRRPDGFPAFRRVDLDTGSVRRRGDALADCRTRKERSGIPLLGVRDPLAPCAERLRKFARSTYLAQDMLQLAQWHVEGRAVAGLRSEAHVMRAPGARPELWRGKIAYRPSAASSRTGRAGAPKLVLAQVGTDRGVFRFAEAGSVSMIDVDAFLAGDGAGREGPALELRVDSRAGESIVGGDFLTFQRLGRAAVVGIPSQLGGLRLFIDGVPQGDPDEAGTFDNTRYALLRPDQYVTLEKGRRRLTLQLVETPGAISEYSGRRRLREASLFEVAQRAEQTGLSGNINSTIDAALHHELQKRLALRMRAGESAGRPPRRSYRGAALVMDGLTGEILAAATYPTRVDQLAEADREDPDRLRWLQWNFNFQRLPIGSAAKVPFAAAIAERYPALLAMHIAYRPAFDTVGGHPLVLPGRSRKLLFNAGNGNRGPRVDFNGFLTYSNNEYALTLLQRATLMDRRRKAWKSARGWPANLWRFGCVIPYALHGGWRRVSDSCSAHLWRDQDGFAIGRREAPSEWLNLMMGRTENDYTDFYLNILGANRSAWTSVNLAQSYARILSGRAVNPQLNYLEEPPRSPPLSISGPVWSAIARGMADAFRTGTAKALPAAGVGRATPGLFYFAKTGTPTLADGEDGHVLVLVVARTIDGRPPARPQDICAMKLLAINLQRDASNAVDFAIELLGPKGGGQFLRGLTSPCPPPQPARAAA